MLVQSSVSVSAVRFFSRLTENVRTFLKSNFIFVNNSSLNLHCDIFFLYRRILFWRLASLVHPPTLAQSLKEFAILPWSTFYFKSLHSIPTSWVWNCHQSTTSLVYSLLSHFAHTTFIHHFKSLQILQPSMSPSLRLHKSLPKPSFVHGFGLKQREQKRDRWKARMQQRKRIMACKGIWPVILSYLLNIPEVASGVFQKHYLPTKSWWKYLFEK